MTWEMRRIQRWIFKAVRWQNCKFKRKKGSTQYCDDFLLLTMNLSYHLSTSTGLPWAFLYSISNLMGTSWRFLLLASRHICVVVFFLLILLLCKPDEASPHIHDKTCVATAFRFFFFYCFAWGHTLLCQLLSWKLHQFITFVFGIKTVVITQ